MTPDSPSNILAENALGTPKQAVPRRLIFSAAQDLMSWVIVVSMMLLAFFAIAYMLGAITQIWLEVPRDNAMYTVLLGLTQLILVFGVIYWSFVIVWVKAQDAPDATR